MDNSLLKLHEIKEVIATDAEGVYIAMADITGNDGLRETVPYASYPDDTYGLAPQVREAIGKWIDDERPVSREGS